MTVSDEQVCDLLDGLGKPGRSMTCLPYLCTIWAVAIVVAALTCFATSAYASSMSSSSITADRAGVLLETFSWSLLSNRELQFHQIASQAAVIKAAGITHAWLPPPSVSVDKEGYMPQRWHKFEAENTQRMAIQALKNVNVSVVADAVLNHRCGVSKGACTQQYTIFEDPPAPTWFIVQNDYMCGSSNTFCRPSAGVKPVNEIQVNSTFLLPSNSSSQGDRLDESDCGCIDPDTGDNFCGAPDVNHADERVRTLVVEYLQLIMKFGYQGLRFDMVKGFSGEYIADYVHAASSSLQFAVGEFYDGSLPKVLNWMRNARLACPAFDFPLRFLLDDCVSTDDYSRLGTMSPEYSKPIQGIASAMLSPAGVVAVYPTLAITFVDNHDTARNTRFGSGSLDLLSAGYAFVLMHPGFPTVFWPDLMDHNSVASDVHQLLALRRSAGISSGSHVRVISATSGLYAALVTPSLQSRRDPSLQIQTLVTVKIGSRSWSPPDDLIVYSHDYDLIHHRITHNENWRLRLNGKRFAVWTMDIDFRVS